MPSLPVNVVALVCTLSPSPAASSSDLLARQLLEAFPDGSTTEVIRVVDHHVAPGVEADMGGDDAWPAIREKVLAADVLVLTTPTWMGQASSVCQRVLERLDAELSYNDDDGRPHLFGKVAIAGVVGNEDGAHHISAILYQCLNDVGYTIPAQGVSYWNGEAMHGKDYQDLETTPEATANTTRVAARNAAHLATVLRASQYPSA